VGEGDKGYRPGVSGREVLNQKGGVGQFSRLGVSGGPRPMKVWDTRAGECKKIPSGTWAD